MKKNTIKGVKGWWYKCNCSKDTQWGYLFRTKKDAKYGACKDAIIYPVLITPITKVAKNKVGK